MDAAKRSVFGTLNKRMALPDFARLTADEPMGVGTRRDPQGHEPGTKRHKEDFAKPRRAGHRTKQKG
jgi:hypothetical protein